MTDFVPQNQSQSVAITVKHTLETLHNCRRLHFAQVDGHGEPQPQPAVVKEEKSAVLDTNQAMPVIKNEDSSHFEKTADFVATR